MYTISIFNMHSTNIVRRRESIRRKKSKLLKSLNTLIRNAVIWEEQYQYNITSAVNSTLRKLLTKDETKMKSNILFKTMENGCFILNLEVLELSNVENMGNKYLK